MSIVVFDSGFGSLSIIREIQKKFKGELIYFADQKNFPYGVKSKKELEQIIKKTIVLLEKEFSPQLIVMASNTPTLLLDYNKISSKLVGVYPPLDNAVKLSKTRNIAILGTKSVIQSEAITEFIEKCNVPNDIVIHKIDCSSLVELVESGKFLTDKEYCKNIIKEVLEDVFLDNLIDVATLSSTHLPFLELLLKSIFKNIKFLDPAKDIVNGIKDFKLENNELKQLQLRIFTSGDVNLFEKNLQMMGIKNKVNSFSL
ncbi:MAG TPA: glutamate racemase [Candidatus Nitrosopelagicus sp.]|nr:glutamate racemase [Candidatus Nitrosopelagicus sp.]|tara:strand:- start:746 stop:1516 length:771 start_codon:yes stop_codon:yes gene_type:complete